MRSDESGVAGFFEDLPVLAFVLCGVLLLVSSSLWVSAQLAGLRENERLEKLTDRAADMIVEVIGSSTTSYDVPTMQSIERSNLFEYLNDLLRSVHYALNISKRGGQSDWYVMVKDCFTCEVSQTAFASRLLNAIDGSGLVVVLEVRLIVWRE